MPTAAVAEVEEQEQLEIATGDDPEEQSPTDEDGDGSAVDEQDAGDAADGESDAGDPDATVVVTIGDEEPPEDEPENRAPDWVRDVRQRSREKDSRIRELEAENRRLKGGGQAPAAVVVGEKPTLEGCDFDSEKFERELEGWHERKRQVAEEERKRKDAEAAAKAAWDAKLADYGKAKAALKVKDFEDAEDIARDALSVTQQGVILNGAENPALVVYALGRNPKKAKELAAITDPVKFAFAVAKLETQLKVTPRKTAPSPERKVSSSAGGATAVDNQLERLRKEAQQTGSMDKVLAYKRTLRQKQA